MVFNLSIVQFMKPGVRITIIFSSVLLALAGCGKSYMVSKSQEIVFQVEFFNTSDSSSLKGFYIDVNGNILTYESPKKWHFPDNDQIIKKADLKSNLSVTKTAYDKVPNDELQKYVKYIDNIAASKVTLPKIHHHRKGTLSFYCYQYSEGAEEYKRTLIRSEGYINCENLNFFSKKAVSWLLETEKSKIR